MENCMRAHFNWKNRMQLRVIEMHISWWDFPLTSPSRYVMDFISSTFTVLLQFYDAVL